MPEDFEKPIKPGELSIDIIKNSMCIITDTGTKARIEDPRALEGKFVVKIDHHAPDDHSVTWNLSMMPSLVALSL